MTRKKVKLAYITNEATRKATFKKRRKGLLKKLNELSILCGIEASAIIYSPYDSNPEAWPSPIAVQTTIERLRKMSETDQSKNKVNPANFLKKSIKKAHEQLKKQQKENREKKITQVMYKCLIGDGLQILGNTDLSDLGWLVDKTIMEVEENIESFQRVQIMKPLQSRTSMNNNEVVLCGETSVNNTTTDMVTMDSIKDQKLMEFL